MLTTEHWSGAVSVILQTLGVSMLLANTLNMAANNDIAFAKKSETQPLTAADAA